MRPVQFAPFITPACISLVYRNLLPKAIKPKLLQKAGCGNGLPGIQRGFAGARAAKTRWVPLPQAPSSLRTQTAPFTQHWVPIPCTVVVGPELLQFLWVLSHTRISICLHLEAHSPTGTSSLSPRQRDTYQLSSIFQLANFPLAWLLALLTEIQTDF